MPAAYMWAFCCPKRTVRETRRKMWPNSAPWAGFILFLFVYIEKIKKGGGGETKGRDTGGLLPLFKTWRFCGG